MDDFTIHQPAPGTWAAVVVDNVGDVQRLTAPESAELHTALLALYQTGVFPLVDPEQWQQVVGVVHRQGSAHVELGDDSDYVITWQRP